MSGLAATLIREDVAASLDLAGATLVVPALSLGSVDQMAVDLLVNSLFSQGCTGVVRLGLLATPFVQPVIGGRPYGASGPETAGSLEVYHVPAARVVIVQQRAPAVSGQHEALVAALLEWAAGAGIASLVVLAAVDGISRVDADFKAATPLRYIAAGSDAAAEAAGALPLHRAPHSAAAPVDPAGAVVIGADGGALSGSAPAAAPASASVVGWVPPTGSAVAQTALAFSGVWGSGYAPVYFRRALSSSVGAGEAASPAPALRSVLAVLASEGVNSPHAAALAELAAQVVGLAPLLPPEEEAAAAAAPPSKGGRGAASGAAGRDALPERLGRFFVPHAWRAGAASAAVVDPFLFP